MITGLACISLSPSGEVVTEPSQYLQVCSRYLQKSDEGRDMCRDSYQRVAHQVATMRRTITFRCHAGFSYFAVPVIVNDMHLLTFICGQVLTRGFDWDLFNKVLDRLGEDRNELEIEMQRIQAIPDEQFLATREMVENLIGMISSLNFRKFGLDKNLAQLAALNEIADLVGAVGDMDVMMHNLLGKICQLVGMTRAALILRDDKMDRYLVAATDPPGRDFRVAYSKLTRDVLFERRMMMREPYHFELTDNLDEPEASIYHSGNIASRLVVPLTVRDRVIGLMELYPEAGFPDVAVLNLFITVAAQAAVAIDNAAIFSHAERLAVTDGLTGLNNFRNFHKQLSLEMKRAQRYRTHLSLIMIDIDNFKAINKKYGHLLGNVVLAEFAALLRSKVREVDFVARYGGEEFVIILPETPLVGAEILGGRLGEAIAEHNFPGPGRSSLHLTASIGLVGFKEGLMVPEKLLEMVDRALLKAKDKGPGNMIVWKEKDEKASAGKKKRAEEHARKGGEKKKSAKKPSTGKAPKKANKKITPKAAKKIRKKK